jgi:hypothetical protein
VKELVELLGKAHLTEVFAHENAQMKGEKEILQTYQLGSLIYVRSLLTYTAAL